MKASPKSCSCRQCMASKSAPTVKIHMRNEERSFRYKQKRLLQQEQYDDLSPAVHGMRFG